MHAQHKHLCLKVHTISILSFKVVSSLRCSLRAMSTALCSLSVCCRSAVSCTHTISASGRQFQLTNVCTMCEQYALADLGCSQPTSEAGSGKDIVLQVRLTRVCSWVWFSLLFSIFSCMECYSSVTTCAFFRLRSSSNPLTATGHNLLGLLTPPALAVASRQSRSPTPADATCLVHMQQLNRAVLLVAPMTIRHSGSFCMAW